MKARFLPVILAPLRRTRSNSMKSKLLFLCGALFLTAGLPSPAWAQAVGEIVGIVTDPSGAVVPSAKVTAVQEGTGFTRSTVSGASGTYTIPNLVVGTYTVTAEVGGFKTGTATGITLDVAQQREVDFRLTMAGVTSTVEVNAAPPLLNTTNGTLGGLVTGDQVQTLPLNGRSITNLVMMQPGINMETDMTGWISQEWAGNGNRGQTEISTLDGADASDAEFGNVQFWDFNLDAIAEFKVLQNNYSAQYGQGAGTITQIVTKSGTNQFHGSLFEFVRNSVFDARNYFGSTVPPLRRNEFGGTFGGPIQKDKTFFFLQYAGFRQRLGEPNLIPVPTAAERSGAISMALPNGTIDQLQAPIRPLAQQVLNAYPMPNQPTGVFGPNTYNFLFSQPTNNDQFSVRGDDTFSSKDSIFLRASYVNHHNNLTDPVAAIENTSWSANSLNDQRNYTIGETHLLSPTLMNAFSFTMNREITGSFPKSLAVPYTTFTDGSLAGYGADPFIYDYTENQFIVNDQVSWTKGRHTISVGAMFRRLQDNVVGGAEGGPNGDFLFEPGTPIDVAIPSISGGSPLALGTPSPSSLVSFMLGQATTYVRNDPSPGFGPTGGGWASYGVRGSHWNAWFQDDIKASKKLTLNLGLRYELNTVPTEMANRISAIVDDPKFGGGNLFGQLILNPRPFFNPDHLGFGPRLGVAYHASNKTVLRGGFGIFTNLPPMCFPDQAVVNFPDLTYSSTINPPYSLNPLSVSGLPALTSLSGQVLPPNGNTHLIPPNTPVNLLPSEQYLGGPILTNLTSVDFKNGYTLAANLTLEQELPGDMNLQVSYVVNNAVGLYGSQWPNAYVGAQPQYAPYTAVNPGLSEFQLTTNFAHSTYNALQVQLRKISPQHGLQIQASYTYSKAIDNASTVWNGYSGSNSGTTQNNPFCTGCEKAVSGFDFPQRFVMNFDYKLPLDTAKFLSRVPRRVTNGWHVLSIISAQSGFPWTVNSPYGTQQYGLDEYTGFQATRPDLIQAPPLRSSGQPEEQFFASSVLQNSDQYFATPINASGLQIAPGNLGRNTFRTNPFSNFDFSLMKDTRITESKTLQFRAEFFNLFNQHAFGIPGQVLTSPQFGIATATVLAEREIQFGLRFIF